MTCQYIGVIVGAILGFASSTAAECIRRHLDQRDRRKRRKQLLSGIVKEIEEGIDRCQTIVHFRDIDRSSLSRIYTAFWESTIAELLQHIEDPEVLGLLHSIYYRFDLVNFNMEKDRFGSGAAFASQYLEEIQVNLSELQARLNSS